MSKVTEEKNKEPVLEAFDTLFNQHDYRAAVKEWTSNIRGEVSEYLRKERNKE